MSLPKLSQGAVGSEPITMLTRAGVTLSGRPLSQFLNGHVSYVPCNMYRMNSEKTHFQVLEVQCHIHRNTRSVTTKYKTSRSYTKNEKYRTITGRGVEKCDRTLLQRGRCGQGGNL